METEVHFDKEGFFDNMFFWSEDFYLSLGLFTHLSKTRVQTPLQERLSLSPGE